MDKKQTALGACLKSLLDLSYKLYAAEIDSSSVWPHIEARIAQASEIVGESSEENLEAYRQWARNDRRDRAGAWMVRPWAEELGIDLDDIVSPDLPEDLVSRWGADEEIVELMENNNHKEQILHALAKLQEIAKKFDEGTGTDRDLFQFGYNAGRLAELAGAGRIIWDKLKHLVEVGAWDKIQCLVWEWEPEARAGLPIEPRYEDTVLNWDDNPETNPTATR